MSGWSGKPELGLMVPMTIEEEREVFLNTLRVLRGEIEGSHKHEDAHAWLAQCVDYLDRRLMRLEEMGRFRDDEDDAPAPERVRKVPSSNGQDTTLSR